GKDSRNDERQQDERADVGLALEAAIEQQRQPQAQPQFEYSGHRRVPDGIPDHPVKDRVAGQPLEVLQSDELARNADPSVRDGENDPPKERISNEEPQEDGRRQQQNESQPALILQKPPAWWRLGGHRVGSEYRHISISYEYVLTVIASPSKMGRSEPQCGAARGPVNAASRLVDFLQLGVGLLHDVFRA